MAAPRTGGTAKAPVANLADKCQAAGSAVPSSFFNAVKGVVEETVKQGVDVLLSIIGTDARVDAQVGALSAVGSASVFALYQGDPAKAEAVILAVSHKMSSPEIRVARTAAIALSYLLRDIAVTERAKARVEIQLDAYKTRALAEDYLAIWDIEASIAG